MAHDVLYIQKYLTLANLYKGMFMYRSLIVASALTITLLAASIVVRYLPRAERRPRHMWLPKGRAPIVGNHDPDAGTYTPPIPEFLARDFYDR